MRYIEPLVAEHDTDGGRLCIMTRDCDIGRCMKKKYDQFLQITVEIWCEAIVLYLPVAVNDGKYLPILQLPRLGLYSEPIEPRSKIYRPARD